MALTVAAFLEDFGEFREVPTATIERALAKASRRTPADVWGDLEDDAQGYLAAHLLTGPSAFGRDAREDPPDEGMTTYLTERIRMELERAPGAAPRTT